MSDTRYVRTGDEHGFPVDVATSPDANFRVRPLPRRDFAAQALANAQKEYFRNYPDADPQSLIWVISNEG